MRAVFAIRAILRQFVGDRRAATAIEFSIVFLPFLGFVLMIFQAALLNFGLQSLDAAIGNASRAIITGTLAASNRTLATFRDQEICPRLLLNFDCSKVVVNAYKVTPKSDASKNTGIYQFIDTTTVALRQPPAQANFCLGGPGDYAFLDISYNFPNFVGSLLTSVGVPPETFMLRATTLFRLEQYSGQSSTC